MNVNDFKTLAGFTMGETIKELDAELPKDAYSAVPGAADFTDIDPNYMRMVLNKLFGLCGIGWGYRYDPVDLFITTETRARSSGGTRTVRMAALKHMTLWYKLVDPNGNVIVCEIDASGGSENDNEAYAMKGAISNAIGNAVSNIGFQESVYLGKRSHRTVGKAAASSASKNSSADPSKAAPVAKTSAAPSESKTSVSTTPSNSQGLKATPSARSNSTSKITSGNVPAGADPASFVVKIGKRAGKTLGEIYDENTGAEVIRFYAAMATGGNPEKDALKNAAIAFLVKNNGHVSQAVAA